MTPDQVPSTVPTPGTQTPQQARQMRQMERKLGTLSRFIVRRTNILDVFGCGSISEMARTLDDILNNRRQITNEQATFLREVSQEVTSHERMWSDRDTYRDIIDRFRRLRPVVSRISPPDLRVRRTNSLMWYEAQIRLESDNTVTNTHYQGTM